MPIPVRTCRSKDPRQTHMSLSAIFPLAVVQGRDAQVGSQIPLRRLGKQGDTGGDVHRQGICGRGGLQGRFAVALGRMPVAEAPALAVALVQAFTVGLGVGDGGHVPHDGCDFGLRVGCRAAVEAIPMRRMASIRFISAGDNAQAPGQGVESCLMKAVPRWFSTILTTRVRLNNRVVA